MITNAKQHTLTFPKGITNNPSDMLSTDSELAECVNLTYENGEIKPIQQPALKFANPLKGKYKGRDTEYYLRIVFIHNFHKIENYICVAFVDGRYKYVWFRSSDTDSVVTIYDLFNIPASSVSYAGGEDGIPVNVLSTDKFQAVGNTLILCTSKGLNYFLWKNDTYNSLGSDMPEVDVQFKMDNRERIELSGIDMINGGLANLNDILVFVTARHDDGVEYTYVAVNGGSEYNENARTLENAEWGSLNYYINKAHKDKKAFVYPFWVRFAVRLYDGSHTKISNPVLMLPSVRQNGVMYANEDAQGKYIYTVLFASHLFFRINSNTDSLKDWRETIKGINIYVSDEVRTYDITKQYARSMDPFTDHKSKKRDSITMFDGVIDKYYLSEKDSDVMSESTNNKPKMRLDTMTLFVPFVKSDEAIIDELKSTASFFLLAKADFSTQNTWKQVEIKNAVVENITNQPQLEHDDYFGHTHYKPSTIFTYNNRLHLADVERSVFEGFRHFMPMQQTVGDGDTISVYVRIETSSGTRFAKVTDTMPTLDLGMGYYFYYPDPNAKQVYYCFSDSYGNKRMVTYELEEHPFLNGAYYLKSLPNGYELKLDIVNDTITSQYDSHDSWRQGEYLPNEIFNTEVNNPFVINAVGNNTIGNGEIIGLAVNTYALSQGQAGQHPLIVFTTEGIYAMSVATDGTYSNIFNLSREICNNPKSITETDGAIYFTTDKGLMVMVGVQIQLVSLMLSGKNWKRFTSENILPKDNNDNEDKTAFLDFLKGCSIAYDYKGQKLWIINPSMKYHYVYNIGSKIFTKMEDSCIRNVINFFPDTLLQLSDGKVYSFLNKPDINNDENLYDGKFITRPLKFDGALNLETIYQIRNMFLAEGTVTMYVYGSNDLKNWNKLSSITGKPWKYYTFEFILRKWKATDTFTASVVILQPRRAELLR